MEVISFNEHNGTNNYYIVRDVCNRMYVVMHIVNGKFAIYDFEFHDVIEKFTWNPNNGYACSILRQEHVQMFPEMATMFEVNRIIHMHALIKRYCMKEEGEVIHHINGRMRDNRGANLIWISQNQQRALIKPVGKLHKPPVEFRDRMPLLPPFCKWINAKKTFRIEGHPACFAAVERGEQKHKYIESLKGNKHSLQSKFEDFVRKYEELMGRPFGGQESYVAYMDLKASLEKAWHEIVCCAREVAMANLDISESPSKHAHDTEST